MDVVNDLIILINVRNDARVEATLISVHIGPNVLHCKLNWRLYLCKVLHLFDLVVWELILGRAKKTLITKQLLALLLCNDFFRRLL